MCCTNLTVNRWFLCPFLHVVGGAASLAKEAVPYIGYTALSIMALNSGLYMTNSTEVLKKLNTCNYPLAIPVSMKIAANKLWFGEDTCNAASYTETDGHIYQV